MNPREAADLLTSARSERRTLDPFTDAHPELDEAWGYAVQALLREGELAAGDRVVGAKLGLTSAAKQERMGVDRPIVGYLTASMLLPADEIGGAIAALAQPRIEPEIAFVTAHTLDRSLTASQLEAAVAGVGFAAEVIDSRWADYRFRLPDVVADNTSAAAVVLGGDTVPLSTVGDLAALRCEVEVDGEVVHRATGAAILGHPLRALQLLSEHLERHGASLPAGSLVLAGALTDAVPLVAGRRYRLSVEGLGAVEPDNGGGPGAATRSA